MAKTFLVSDTHFGHKGVCHFTQADGVTPLRPWDTPDEMDEDMVRMWNETVSPEDKVYHLGDVVINRKALPTLARLNGDKVLIKGNHDIFRLSEYTPYFREIRAYHVLGGMILSHIPIHSDSLARFGVNVHGHLHSNRVMKAIGFDQKTQEIIYSKDEIDPRYFSVCVEMTEFKPIELEEVKRRIIEQGGSVEFKKNGNGPTM